MTLRLATRCAVLLAKACRAPTRPPAAVIVAAPAIRPSAPAQSTLQVASNTFTTTGQAAAKPSATPASGAQHLQRRRFLGPSPGAGGDGARQHQQAGQARDRGSGANGKGDLVE